MIPDRTRGARPWRVALLAALVVVVGILGLLGVPWALARGGAGAAPTASQTPGCAAVRYEECRELLTSAGKVRYALLGSGADPRVAIFDVGGPGAAVFGAQWPEGFSSTIAPSMPYRGLLLEEPWVGRPVPDRCEAALRAWFAHAHAGDQRSTDLAGPCELGQGHWGWTPESYRAAIDAVEAAEEVHVDGMIGVSFGARRSRYLSGDLTWAVLANPAPREMTGQQYLAARQDALESMLAAQCGCTDVNSALSQIVQQVTGSDAGGSRSVPLTAADVGAAAIALAYQAQIPGNEYATKFWAADPSAIGALADSVWGRYGTDRISPSYLAYLDEVCAAYGPWPTAPTSSGLVGSTLTALHAPCAGIPLAERDTGSQLPAACVSSVTNDPIAPPAFVATWQPVTFTEIGEGSAHANVDGVTDCLTQLLSTATG